MTGERYGQPAGPKPEGRGVCRWCGRPWHEGQTCVEACAALPKIERSHIDATSAREMDRELYDHGELVNEHE